MTKKADQITARDAMGAFKFMAGIGAAGVSIAVTIDALAGGDSTRALAGAAATLFAVAVSADVRAPISSPSTQAATPPLIGQRMADGTVYAGVSPDTQQAMYTTPKDTGLCAAWNKAMDHAANLDAHGQKDWRVPTKAELNALFKNRTAIGNFNETGSSPAVGYWSSSQDYGYFAWAQRFSDGHQNDLFKDCASSLRCVRG